MANVFGDPIEGGTREGRVLKAVSTKHESKMKDVRDYVDNLKSNYGDGVSTKCMIYNATGEPLTFLLDKNFEGSPESEYPKEIKNGQWGGFLHVKPHSNPFQMSGSSGAVVYRGKNVDGAVGDWILAWRIPWSASGARNNAFTEVGKADGFPEGRWGQIRNQLDSADNTTTKDWNEMESAVEIDNATTAFFQATASLKLKP